MKIVAAPRFDLHECNNDSEAEFIELLHRRAEAGQWFADSWLREDRIIVTVGVSDPAYNCILRTLRVDYDGVSATCGPDETQQLVTDLNAARPTVVALRERPMDELVRFVADWLEHEMRRPIDRHEWTRPDFNRRVWVLRDSGEELVWNDSRDLTGGPDLEFGPPDKIIPITHLPR